MTLNFIIWMYLYVYMRCYIYVYSATRTKATDNLCTNLYKSPIKITVSVVLVCVFKIYKEQSIFYKL